MCAVGDSWRRRNNFAMCFENWTQPQMLSSILAAVFCTSTGNLSIRVASWFPEQTPCFYLSIHVADQQFVNQRNYQFTRGRSAVISMIDNSWACYILSVSVVLNDELSLASHGESSHALLFSRLLSLPVCLSVCRSVCFSLLLCVSREVIMCVRCLSPTG